jgi:uncharacterized membrane protein YbaN (DUF454 family)
MKTLYIILGTIFIIIGSVGIIIPVLPTTPFLLLAGFFYIRGSERLYHWLLNNRVLGKYIKDYVEGRPIPKRAGNVSVATLWLFLFASILIIKKVWIGIMLILIGTCVTIYLKKRMED